MSAYLDGIEQLEAVLTDMGRGMTYPPTPRFVSAALARADRAEARPPKWLPSLWPATLQLTRRWLLTVPVAIVLVAVFLVAYAALGGPDAAAPIEPAPEAEAGEKGSQPPSAEVSKEAEAPVADVATSVPTPEAPTPTTVGPAATVAPTSDFEAQLDAHMSYSYSEFTGSILIARGDEVLLSKGYGMADIENEVPNTSQTLFPIRFYTDQFTAVGILMLEEEGLLQTDAPISDYLPDYPGGENITVHHLLTHSEVTSIGV